jgi:hypothetical protein
MIKLYIYLAETDGQLTETGKGTLEELFRVHFPDSKPVDNSRNKQQRQQNLGRCDRTMHRADWNLVKHVINQSRIRWALSTLKPFKAAGTDDRYYRVLTMVYNTQRYWVFGLCPSSGYFLNNHGKTQCFRNWIWIWIWTQ